MTRAFPETPCVCGRVIARRRRFNSKAKVRHKCPHGTWCVRGSTTTLDQTNYPRCKKCQEVNKP